MFILDFLEELYNMANYYRTPSGLFYKEDNGLARRVSRLNYLQHAGAAKVLAAVTPGVTLSKDEQKCVDWAQEKIAYNKANNLDNFKMTNAKGKEFHNIGWLVKTSYEEARVEHPDCAPFYDTERERKLKEKEIRRAKKPRRSPRKTSKSGVRKTSKSKSPRKTSKSKSTRKTSKSKKTAKK